MRSLGCRSSHFEFGRDTERKLPWPIDAFTVISSRLWGTLREPLSLSPPRQRASCARVVRCFNIAEPESLPAGHRHFQVRAARPGASLRKALCEHKKARSFFRGGPLTARYSNFAAKPTMAANGKDRVNGISHRFE